MSFRANLILFSNLCEDLQERDIGRILWCKSLRKSVLRFVLLSQIQTCFGQKCIDFNEG